MNPAHLLPLLLLVIPIIWGFYGYFKTRGEKKTTHINTTGDYWPLIINSAVLYALAFNIIFFIQELFLALGKRWLGLKAYLYHNNHNWEGQHPMDDLAQGYGAVSILVLACICLVIARRISMSTHWMQLFFLWMAYQGFAQSIPQFITAGTAPDTDTGQAFAYLGLTQQTGVIISLAGILLMVFICFRFSRWLLQLAPSPAYVASASSRFSYLFRIALLSSLIGVLLITPFRIMPWSRALLPVFVMLFSIPIVFANAWKAKPAYTINNHVNQRVFPIPVILLLVLLLVFQLVLARGVEVSRW